MSNLYLVNYSNLQGLFYVVKADTRHIYKACNDFGGVYRYVKQLREECDIELEFTDSAIDELQRRNILEGGAVYGVC